MFGRTLNREGSEKKVCPDCQGELLLVRRCPYLAMRCAACGTTHEFKDVSDQMDDPFEEEMGWIPMDRL
ncbi:MAG: hypothetical protein KKB70_01685 [Proteobacteria bacterium]|nr:hypothetical protein [Pseudomonadota bacterium]MBU1611654.1 hypothetical protein [Pseudomonadota bacterium]